VRNGAMITSRSVYLRVPATSARTYAIGYASSTDPIETNSAICTERQNTLMYTEPNRKSRHGCSDR
jgi:hypothetical protein